MAIALCRSCGIAEQSLQDVAREVVLAMRRRPRSRRSAVAVQVAKRWLAKQLALPESALPTTLAELKAVGEYEAVRARYGVWQGLYGLPLVRGFDYHSRRFAAENGVCPRCSRPGHFTEAAGRCGCGFAYGPQGDAPAADIEAA
jgi:hypothetical protein